MKKLLLLLLLLLSSIIAVDQANAEPARILGRVLDTNGRSVAGVKVAVEGQNITATTSKDGSFKLFGVTPGKVYLHATAPSSAYLDSETLKSIVLKGGTTVSAVTITLSGRPSDNATFIGMKACAGCHDAKLIQPFDGTPHASAHSRFVTEGTGHMIYRDMWPEPNSKYLPRDPKNNLLMVQDPRDGKGMVNVVLCTKGSASDREYLFKFYAEQKDGASMKEDELDCSNKPAEAVWIPVAGTIGGEGNWGEGYTDPLHNIPDRYPNFGEGKQRFLARIQDVPVIAKWMKDNNVSREKQKQDYICFLPVYIMQDGTPKGSKALAKGEAGAPTFWQKSPKNWATPDNTLSRNCAGCHATGVKIETKDFSDYKSIVTHWDYSDMNITCERCHGPGSEHAKTSDKAKIISPKYLTAKAGNELCGQCHASHDGKSQNPMGVFKPPFDAKYKNSLV